MELGFREPSATAGRARNSEPPSRDVRSASPFQRLTACRWLMLTVAIACGREATGGEAAAARPARVDPAVTPAGGARAAHAECGECRRAACPQCRLAPERHPGHAPCQHGLCPAHCPVRPDVFGFYGTQWRRWPGSNVVQVNIEAATPARPPRSTVPTPLEESLESDSEPQTLPAPPQAAAGAAPPRPVPPRRGEGQSDREQGRAAGLDLARPATGAERPADPPARVPAAAPATPEEMPQERSAEDSEAEPPSRTPAAEKPSGPQERLFNLDDRPQAAPWRSFTAGARQEARQR